MLTFYRIASTLVAPFMPTFLNRRRQRGKEDAARLSERLGHASQPRPEGALIWVHAASVGESRSVLPLIEKLGARHPALHFLITTGTITSANLLAANLPARTLHQFVPIDTPGAVRRFLAHWKPDIALWTESEFWPNLITMAQRQGCRFALINGRISASSFEGWQRFPSLIREILRCFSILFPQSEEDARRLRQLGASALGPVGNLKYDAPPLEADEVELNALKAAIATRPVWVAASTHEGEEDIAAQVHYALKDKHPDLLTIIIPRHAERGENIAAKLKGRGFALARRSLGERPTRGTDIYLADTMGELGLFYRLSNIAFIGGSLVPHGGQNPLEAARLACVVIAGPHMFNFQSICEDLATEMACIRVKTPEELQRKLTELLAHPELREALAQAALAVATEKRGVIDRIVTELQPLLKGL